MRPRGCTNDVQAKNHPMRCRKQTATEALVTIVDSLFASHFEIFFGRPTGESE
jgi:hypothetical protein